MSQTEALLKALKRELKTQGKTYADVARVLDLSEASIKRLFRDGDMSIPRLAAILEFLGIDFVELALSIDQDRHKLLQLSKQQEQQIAADRLLLLVAICVVNRLSFSEILGLYTISEAELIRKLALLDRLKIIDLLPGNRIKLRIAPNFAWLRDGPIERFFHEQVKQEFFHSRFSGAGDKLIVAHGMVSSSSNAELQRRMQSLANYFVEASQQDAALPLDDRHAATLVLAVRQWHFSLFREFERR